MKTVFIVVTVLSAVVLAALHLMVFISRLKVVLKVPTKTVPKPPVEIEEMELFRRLMNVAKREGCLVYPTDRLMWARNKSDWGKDWGRPCLGKYDPYLKHVMLRTDRMYDPWVLAHELGHHESMKHGDASETSADAEGRKIVLSVLAPKETAALLSKIEQKLSVSRKV